MSLRMALIATALPGAVLAAELPAGAGMPGNDTVDGVVSAFTLALDGTVNGLLLNDGTEVHTSARVAAAVVAAVQPGDAVRVQGLPTPTPGVLVAIRLTDSRSGRAVVEPGLAPTTVPLAVSKRDAAAPPGPPPPGAREVAMSGRVLRPLHGPDGTLDGALLGDGTDLRLPAGAARRLARLLEPGTKVAVKGYTVARPYGQVMAVEAIGDGDGDGDDALTPVVPPDPEPPDPEPPQP